MTASPVPAYVPDEWAPTKMTRKQYDDQRAHLVRQQEAAASIVGYYGLLYSGAVAHPRLGLHDSVGDAWNAAHDAVTALDAALASLDREWESRNVDPYQRFLVANNCD